ncbi:hypothetical protein ACFQI7_14910 [Paenibacillus allorhizosphaerae]|nr:hypothetical protein [Paenibacillus allorhizosphaerae]
MNHRVDFENGDLIIGTFFTASTKAMSEKEPKRPIDRRIGLYASNNGTDFTYLGESGLSGRDSSLMYKDGTFYMLSTASEKELFAVHIQKSSDLMNWTNLNNARYEITNIEGKRPGKVYNWGPKWVEDGDKTYVIVSFESSQPRITHGLLPFPSYPIMDTYIIPVESWGTDDQSKEDLNRKNIAFGKPRKVNWGEGEGLSYKLYKGEKEQISRIGSYVFIHKDNKQKYGYSYILFTKVDPWGEIEVWGADDLMMEIPWKRILTALVYSGTGTEAPNEFIDAGSRKFKRLFEGNYPVQIGDTFYLYTDNYVYNSANLITDGGMYYTTFTDLTKGFGNPKPIQVANTNQRPSGIEDYVTRNGNVKNMTNPEAKKVIAAFSMHKANNNVTKLTKENVSAAGESEQNDERTAYPTVLLSILAGASMIMGFIYLKHRKYKKW